MTEKKATFLKQASKNHPQDPNFILVDPRVAFLFKKLCRQLSDTLNETTPVSSQIFETGALSQEVLLIDNQTGQIIKSS